MQCKLCVFNWWHRRSGDNDHVEEQVYSILVQFPVVLDVMICQVYTCYQTSKKPALCCALASNCLDVVSRIESHAEKLHCMR